jgi:DNA-3-methyladenine glycosylase II
MSSARVDTPVPSGIHSIRSATDALAAMPRITHAAYDHLAAADPDLAQALAKAGRPPARHRPRGFEGLARIIVAQQVSSAAAATMWNRLAAAVDPLEPAAVAALPFEMLRGCGLSRQKAAYVQHVAAEIASGRLDLRKVHRLPDEPAVAALTALKGIGRWSAEIYLLFALRRPDVMPAGDLALQVAAQHLKGLRSRPSPERLMRLAEAWRPHRSAAALLLWHYYHHLKGT